MTADLERGYGDEPRDVAETIAMAIDAGAVGANLERRRRRGPAAGSGGEPIHAKYAVARGRAEAEGVPFVINARTDVFLLRRGRRRARSSSGAARTPRRGRTASSSPASAIPRCIAALVAGLPIGMNVLGHARRADARRARRARRRPHLARPGPMGVALAALRRAAETVLARGELPADLAFRPGI